jgi:hypothetical protein
VFGTGFPPKYIPSFAWCGTQQPYQTYQVEKAIALARVVMARRNMELSEAEADLLREVYHGTVEDRRRNGIQE